MTQTINTISEVWTTSALLGAAVMLFTALAGMISAGGFIILISFMFPGRR